MIVEFTSINCLSFFDAYLSNPVPFKFIDRIVSFYFNASTKLYIPLWLGTPSFPLIKLLPSKSNSLIVSLTFSN